MSVWKTRIARLVGLVTELLRRYPRAIAVFGFVSGLASFLLVDRQASLAKLIAVTMLVSWLWLVLESTLRRCTARWFGFDLPPPLLRYATQMIHQESLFFVLPFFFITTTWNSGQALFTGLLGAAALASITDPLYYKGLAARRWVFMSFHSLTLFAVLLTALPIILHLSTPQAYVWSLGVAAVLSFPSLIGSLKLAGWRRWLISLMLMLVLGAVGWQARLWVPPSTLWLGEVAVTEQFDDLSRKPGVSVESISAAQLKSQGLYAFTRINAPRGLKERIYHVWQHDGQIVDRIALDIHGGGKEGYRSWTHKQNFPDDVVGDWQVQVVTEAGQMIGVLRFEVTP
ncbi:DUF5924 family protein [Pseudomonas kuykendallii]|uniref:DUF2914 domain-containing protein n=1 Tax=Pseudomonas kuykendallii TaxID=1007099 RepID=A0A2W5D9L8_9PSED|nr:DUF5924 family protein [Pseudomonas kuykendallii]PZP26394.1 MAG: DUF2914 domain-containing protein [Pseudomonas kuykendallii]